MAGCSEHGNEPLSVEIFVRPFASQEGLCSMKLVCWLVRWLVNFWNVMSLYFFFSFFPYKFYFKNSLTQSVENTGDNFNSHVNLKVAVESLPLQPLIRKAMGSNPSPLRSFVIFLNPSRHHPR
jgi:hypothetical protein